MYWIERLASSDVIPVACHWSKLRRVVVNTVRYDQVNAMLLNEFLKAHRKMKEHEATIAWQREQIQALAVRLDQQATEIREVREKVGRNTTFAADGSE
jgi:hypothetical protein